jgi:hypothetical protein
LGQGPTGFLFVLGTEIPAVCLISTALSSITTSRSDMTTRHFQLQCTKFAKDLSSETESETESEDWETDTTPRNQNDRNFSQIIL